MITPRADLGFALALRMIAERGRRFSRLRLISFFWPDATAQDASHALSVALHKLRARGVGIQRSDSGELWIPKEQARVDVDTIPDLTPAELAGRELTLLPDYQPRGSAEFRHWYDDWSSQLHRTAARAVSLVLANAEQDDDWPNALVIAEQLLALDPGSDYARAVRARAAAALQRGGRCHLRPSSAAEVREPTRAPGTTPRQRMRPRRLIGRERERGLLSATCHDLRRGRGRYVHVHGPAGVGKSRFASEVVHVARPSGAASLAVTCHAPHLHKPLSTIVAVASRLLRFPGAAGCSPQNVAVLHRLLNHDVAERTPPPEAAEPEHVLQSTRRALVDLVESVTDEQPLVLVLDNLHWADPASRGLLQTLAEITASLPLVFVTTSSEPCALTRTEVLSLPLRPLCIQEAEVYARAVAQDTTRDAGTDLDDELVRWIVRASGGNPLWIEELVAHAVANGGRAELPPALTSLLAARVEALSAPARRLLQIVAVLNGKATVSILEAVSGYDPPTLLHAFEELDGGAMLEGPDSSTGAVACRHDAVEAAALASAAPATLKLLHRRAAKVLTSSTLDGTTLAADTLFERAAHLQRSGDTTPAVAAILSCIRYLAVNGLVAPAFDTIHSLLSNPLPPADRRVVVTAQAELLHAGRRWQELAACIQTERGDRTPVHDRLELLGLDAAWHLGRQWDAIIDRARKCLDSDADATHRFEAGIIALRLATNTARPDIMAAVHSRLELIAGEPDVSPRSAALAATIFHTICGSVDEARAAAARLLDAVASTTTPGVRAAMTTDCAAALYRLGDPRYLEVYESAVTDAEVNGLPWLAAEFCERVASTLTERGECDGARLWLKRAEELQPLGALGRSQRQFVVRARLHMAAGALRDAARLLAEHETLLRDPVPMFRAAIVATKVWYLLEVGAPRQELEHWITTLTVLSERVRRMGAQDFMMLVLARATSVVRGAHAGEEVLRQYTKHERRDPFPIPPALLAMLRMSAPA